MESFHIRKGSTLPDLKYPLTQRMLNKYDISRDMMENVAVTFSMINQTTGKYKIANVSAKLTINEAADYNNLDDPRYELTYCFKTKDTNKEGKFFGEFLLNFLGDHSGGITFPINSHISIFIGTSITKTTIE